MHRQTDYPYQVPFETDFLYAQRFAYEGLGLLAMDILGSTALVSGLACVPTSPLSLAVKIGPGRVYSLQNYEDTAWGQLGGVGGLAADTALDHQIIKQGLYRDTTTLATMAAPGTVGQSINYLIEASFSEVDALPLSLPFVASTPPYAPIAPNTLNTVRQDKCVITVKAGVAAATGTQVTPSVDAGNVGLYVVTVANGQTTITSGNISLYSGAPFISETLTQKISQAFGDGRYLQIANARIRLAANTSFFVRSDGNDSNTGLANNAGGAFLTIQGAVTALSKLWDFNGFTVTVNIQAGTFGGVGVTGLFVGQQTALVLNGVGSTTIIAGGASAGVNTDAGAIVSAQNMKIGSTSTNGIAAFGASQIAIGAGVEFTGAGSGANAIVAVGTGGTVRFNANCTVSGGAGCLFNAGTNGFIVADTKTFTFTGTPAFSVIVAQAVQCAQLSFTNCTFTGAVTGQRYLAGNNGVVFTNGGGATYFPGSSAGAQVTGGQYN